MRFVTNPQQGDSWAVELSDGAFEWLVSQGRSPAVERLDLYRDTAFSGEGLTDLLEAVGSALRSKADTARQELTATAKLPKDPAIRERILNDLVERALDSDGAVKDLRELQSFIELASERSAVVHVDSD